MKFAFIDAQKSKYPVRTLCRVLGVSRSGFYAWATRKASQHALDDEDLVVRVKAVHAKARRVYGSPRVQRQLAREGVKVSRKRVARLMRREGIVGRRKRRYTTTTNSKHENPIALNLLDRKFHVEEPGRVMVGDTTAIETRQGFLDVALLTDLCTRAIVGWSTSSSNDRHLALDALAKARQSRRPGAGIIVHSDRGSPYASDDYRAALRAMGARQSMSCSGDCWDNAVAESFFSSAKTDLAIRQPLPSFRVAKAMLA